MKRVFWYSIRRVVKRLQTKSVPKFHKLFLKHVLKKFKKCPHFCYFTTNIVLRAVSMLISHSHRSSMSGLSSHFPVFSFSNKLVYPIGLIRWLYLFLQIYEYLWQYVRHYVHYKIPVICVIFTHTQKIKNEVEKKCTMGVARGYIRTGYIPLSW